MAAMLIAMEARGQEIADMVRTPIRLSLLVLDRRALGTVLSELASAIAATAALGANQVSADP